MEENKFKHSDRAIQALASGKDEGFEDLCLAASKEAWELVEKEMARTSGTSFCLDLSYPFFPIADTNSVSWQARMKKRDEALKKRSKTFRQL